MSFATGLSKARILPLQYFFLSACQSFLPMPLHLASLLVIVDKPFPFYLPVTLSKLLANSDKLNADVLSIHM